MKLGPQVVVRVRPVHLTQMLIPHTSRHVFSRAFPRDQEITHQERFRIQS